eukprot:1161401-Pelagomonas_calceolata.AAC.13
MAWSHPQVAAMELALRACVTPFYASTNCGNDTTNVLRNKAPCMGCACVRARNLICLTPQGVGHYTPTHNRDNPPQNGHINVFRPGSLWLYFNVPASARAGSA